MKILRKVALWAFSVIGFLIFVCASLIYGPSFIQPLYLSKLRYEIPGGYRGWVQYEVSNAHCPPLGRDGRFLVYVIDSRGYGCTSDALPEGWRTNRYEFVWPDGRRQNLPETGWGNGGLIWDPMYREQGARNSFVFFVGTEQQFHDAESRPIE
jgi:hypothetical protein